MQPSAKTIRHRRIAMVVLALLTLAVYGRNVTFDFINWDDLDLVVENPLLNPAGGAHLIEIWTGPVKSLYTPLAYTVWTGAALVGRTETPDAYGISLNPAVFHAINVLLHAACVLLVFDVLLRLPLPGGERAGVRGETSHGDQCSSAESPPTTNALRPTPFVEERFAPHLTSPLRGEGPMRILPALIGAAIFAVHPLQVEAVAWISGMNNVLAGLFSLASIAAYLRFARSPTVSAKWYVLTVVALLLALLSKPTAIVVPPMLLVIDWLIIRRPIAKALLGTVGLFAAAVPFVVIGRIVQTADDIVAPAFGQRLMVMVDSIGFYFAKLAWPWPLVFDYGRVPKMVMDHGAAPSSWIALGAAAAVVIACLLRRRFAWAGAVGVFVVGVLPVSGITLFAYQLYSTVADRYAYLSMLGVAMLVAMLLASISQRITTWFASAAVIVLAGVCFAQNGYWQDSYTVSRHALAYNANSFAAHDTLGYVLRRDQQLDEAGEHFRQAVAIKPNDPLANMNLGTLLMQLGRPQEGVIYLRRARDWGYTEPKLMYALGSACLQINEPAEAIDSFQSVLSREPSNVPTQSALGYALAATGKLEDAERCFRKALQIDANFSPARLGLSRVMAAQNQKPN